jgi:mono/diheme cytochrome c family protein
MNPRVLVLASAALSATWVLASCSTSHERSADQWPLSRAELEKSAPSEDPAERTYRRYCISCHGVDGRGNGGVTGADLGAVDSPLTTKSDDELLISVRDGKRGTSATMPAHGPVLSEAEIRAVLAYVRGRFEQQGGPSRD